MYEHSALACRRHVNDQHQLVSIITVFMWVAMLMSSSLSRVVNAQFESPSEVIMEVYGNDLNGPGRSTLAYTNDGKTMIGGIKSFTDGGKFAAGIAHIYACQGICEVGGAVGDTWPIEATLKPSGGPVLYANFGYAVAIETPPVNGECVAAVTQSGHHNSPNFKVTIFTKSTGMWSETSTHSNPSVTVEPYFGQSIVFILTGSGTLNLVVSDAADITANDPRNFGGIYMLEESSPFQWEFTPTFLYFAIGSGSGSLTGDIACYGSSFTSYWFERNADGTIVDGSQLRVVIFAEATPNVWTNATTLTAPNNEDGLFTGYGLVVSGNTLAIPGSAGSDGMVFIYTQTSPDIWEYVTTLHGLLDSSIHGRYGNLVLISPSFLFVYYQISLTIDVWQQTTPSVWETIYTETRQDITLKLVASNNIFVWTQPLYYDTLVVFDFDPIDDCIGHVCEHGATCHNEYKTYSCTCPASHGGDLCIDCLCENGGICQDDVDTGVGYCDCVDTPRFTGTTCHKSCNNGVSEAYPSNSCNCTGSGAEGKFCTNDIDDCASSPCANNGQCDDRGDDMFPQHPNEFNCSCGIDSPYVGPTCEDTLCISSPCGNGGTCVNREDFACNCSLTGYEGEFCQTEIDECASSPCLNKGICTDLLDSYECTCTATGYEGLTCSIDIDDCASSPCQNGGTCQDKGKNKYQCTCTSFWKGSTCTAGVDDCVSRGYECLNGGTCTDDPLNLGEILCTCEVEDGGFTGKYCHVPIESACVSTNPCFHGGKCQVDHITKQMSCNCDNTGYGGDVCDIVVYTSECISSPCLNGGQCYDPSDEQNNFFCDCSAGYSGTLCEIFPICDSMPCENGGTCSNEDDDGYTCACLNNFSGVTCEVDDSQNIVGGSSTSSVEDKEVNQEEELIGQKKDDHLVLIIIIALVSVFILGAVGGAWYVKSKQPVREYMMPT